MNLRANMQWVNGLHFNNLRGDIYGGLTAAVVALPLAMSMGVASGVGPIAGIYGAIFVGLFAAIAGGTPSQVSGPTGPMTVVMAAIFTQYTGMYPDNLAHGANRTGTYVSCIGVHEWHRHYHNPAAGGAAGWCTNDIQPHGCCIAPLGLRNTY
jgi:SulP family sulfate permease